ncbi:hypothetical protein AP285_00510 [Limnospira platensis YZ]|nr:hypothetical protein AP285_00510 [Arthrospira platensis YZ]KDR56348.1 hypothetical protein APPUASWS_017425 [Arthrospira platensis str. Paraca]BAI87990.1 hypothetical protein NIES39_A01510 [Arthrospira platensis NIES-39]
MTPEPAPTVLGVSVGFGGGFTNILVSNVIDPRTRPYSLGGFGFGGGFTNILVSNVIDPRTRPYSLGGFGFGGGFTNILVSNVIDPRTRPYSLGFRSGLGAGLPISWYPM